MQSAQYRPYAVALLAYCKTPIGKLRVTDIRSFLRTRSSYWDRRKALTAVRCFTKWAVAEGFLRSDVGMAVSWREVKPHDSAERALAALKGAGFSGKRISCLSWAEVLHLALIDSSKDRAFKEALLGHLAAEFPGRRLFTLFISRAKGRAFGARAVR
ncbi:MAG: hypothetical protein ACYDGW_02795 [Vulcanimicrobiaceae bacterium]